MENHTQATSDAHSPTAKNTNWLFIAAIILVIVIAGVYYLTVVQGEKEPLPTPVVEVSQPEPAPVSQPEPEPAVEEELELPLAEAAVVEESIEEPEPVKVILPNLDESDSWIKQQLSELTWRKELLRLVIDDDMIRRLVVFTDNFAQGNLAYDYSPLVSPNAKFSAIEHTGDGNRQTWLWDDAQARRFSLYVDLLRSFEPEQLASWYVELKPLIAEAYAELGYPDQNFTETLQDAITRVLDMEIPKDDIALVRPSVMYKFADKELESLPEADKLLLRIGKENLLIIKSFLLEFSDALSRAEAE